MNTNNLILYHHFPAESTRLRMRIKKEEYHLLFKRYLKRGENEVIIVEFRIVLWDKTIG
jgi:hypothetical protein